MMGSISNITSACKDLTDQMSKSAQGWHDSVQKIYYDRRLHPLIGAAAEYQSKAHEYLRLLDEYNRQIASMADFCPIGTGIGEHELFRQQIDPWILEQIKSKQY